MSLGLCLSGGGIKGAAHIGALQALEEENIKFDYLSGTSSGSIVASLYSIGYTPAEIYQLFSKYICHINYVEPKNVIKIIYGLITKGKITIDGMNSGEIIEKIINEAALKKSITNISQIRKPLIIPSIDLQSGEVYFFSSVELKDSISDNIININNINIGAAVRASCSYPGIFSPYKYNNRLLVDGGIKENVPWKGIKGLGATKTLAIVFETEEKKRKEMNIINVIENSFNMLVKELSEYEDDGVDIIIKIKSDPTSLLDKTKFKLFYEKGYKEVKKNIDKIRI